MRQASEKRSLLSKINDYIFAIVEIHGLVSSCVCVRLMCILVNNRNQFVPQQQQQRQKKNAPTNQPTNEPVAQDLFLLRNSGFASRKSSNPWCGFTRTATYLCMSVCVSVWVCDFHWLWMPLEWCALSFPFFCLFCLFYREKKNANHASQVKGYNFAPYNRRTSDCSV